MLSIKILPSLWRYNNAILIPLEVYMVSETAKFTLRTEIDLLKKFRYVAEYNARSANRELEVLMKSHVADFEKEHGKINFESDPT